MARLRPAARRHTHRILLIDDDVSLLESTRAVLTRDGHDVICASDPREGVELVRRTRPHLILLDYMMPGMSGADVVRAIREFDTLVQVLLVTGYAEDQPGRKLLHELDIQDFHDKGDGPDRLMVQADAALKHFRVVDQLARQQRTLMKMVESGPELTRLQPVQELFQTALEKMIDLLGVQGDALVATSNDGLLVMRSAEERVSVRAGTGKYSGCSTLSQLPEGPSEVVRTALEEAIAPQVEGFVAVPLRTRDGARGCILVETADSGDRFEHLRTIFAQQIVQAIENVLLYEQATHDTLTRAWNRSFGMQRLEESLKLSSRSASPTSVVLVDVDHFKHINDTWGHAAGDLALVRIARVLREAVRSSDVVCRYGGEEFLVVLPDTGLAGARTVAEKVRKRLVDLAITFEGHQIPITASAGVAATRLEAWDPDCAGALIRDADTALYAAKEQGRNRVCCAAARDAAE